MGTRVVMGNPRRPQGFLCYFAETHGDSCTQRRFDLDIEFVGKRRAANPMGWEAGDIVTP
jgi:hypothetical protein